MHSKRILLHNWINPILESYYMFVAHNRFGMSVEKGGVYDQLKGQLRGEKKSDPM